jgi:hypothetical protein
MGRTSLKARNEHIPSGLPPGADILAAFRHFRVVQILLQKSVAGAGEERNVYTCPAGKTLTTTGKLVNNGETLLYLASTRDCRSCLLKAQCCPKTPFRRIPRSIYEEARDVARALAKTEAFEQSRRDRKRIEMLFAHLKRILRLGRLRLRGLRGAQFEFTLAAIAQNLRRLAKLVARPPPIVPAAGVA